MEDKANPGKKLIIEVEGQKYLRLPIKTHVITSDDNIINVAEKYAFPRLKDGDYLFISERVVAISQGRAFPIAELKPSFWAKLLSKFVYKSPYGIGLGSTWTMELALREAGLPRILLGVLASAVTKPFGIRGVFYRVVGKNISAIDGPCSYTMPPYNKYAKLAPKDPDKVARQIKKEINAQVVIIDANDLGVNILGRSDAELDTKWAEAVFKDNPLGQTDECTPLCIVRQI